MTAQIHDTVTWRDRRWSLVGADGLGLFDPSAHGIVTIATHTANWRGWVARYTVRDGALLLAELTDVGVPPGEHGQPNAVPGYRPPPLHGVEIEMLGTIEGAYREVDMPIAFTGDLAVADGFIRELYVHMGFQPAWRYEEVWQLTFAEGRLTNELDRSAEARSARDAAT